MTVMSTIGEGGNNVYVNGQCVAKCKSEFGRIAWHKEVVREIALSELRNREAAVFDTIIKEAKAFELRKREASIKEE